MKELLLYLTTAAAYVALGVFFPELLISWVGGTAFLLAGVVGMPALVRRLR